MDIQDEESILGKTFHPFERLPFEIREAIWRLAQPPRIVEVLSTEDDYAAEAEYDFDESEDILRFDEPNCDPEYVAGEGTFSTPARLPSALLVNQDSRNAVIGLYPHAFGGVSGRTRIRFNFKLDKCVFRSYVRPSCSSPP